MSPKQQVQKVGKAAVSKNVWGVLGRLPLNPTWIPVALYLLKSTAPVLKAGKDAESVWAHPPPLLRPAEVNPASEAETTWWVQILSIHPVPYY
jgi:hypothetical protein